MLTAAKLVVGFAQQTTLASNAVMIASWLLVIIEVGHIDRIPLPLRSSPPSDG